MFYKCYYTYRIRLNIIILKKYWLKTNEDINEDIREDIKEDIKRGHKMQKFSEYLNDYILNEDISYRKAAELCQMDRTLLRRYTTGERLPRNLDRVLEMAEKLGMSKEEEKKFCRSYRVSQMHQVEYETMKHIEHIIQAIQKKEKNKKYLKALHGKAGVNAVEKGQDKGRWEENQIKKITGMKEMQDVLEYIVTSVTDIKVKMQPKHTKIASELFYPLVDSNCSIEQICIMKQLEQETQKEIVHGFEKLLPIFLGGKHHKVYCQMDKEAEDGEMMIISEKGCLLISSGEKMQGIFTNKPAYRKYYWQLFEQELKRCRLIGENITNSYFMEEKCEQNYEMKAELLHIVFFYQKKPEERIWIKTGEKDYSTFVIMERNIMEMLYKFIMFYN